jgi:DNA-binding transcriptional MerR regulator
MKQDERLGETPLTRNQVARRLGLSAEWVRQLSDAGLLPCVRTPLGRLYDAADVERFARHRATQRRASP